jgi:hypothetical protein
LDVSQDKSGKEELCRGRESGGARRKKELETYSARGE